MKNIKETGSELTPHNRKKLNELAAFLIELAQRFKAEELAVLEKEKSA